MPLGAVVVNRVLPELFTRADEEAFDAYGRPVRDPRVTAPAGGAPRCSTRPPGGLAAPHPGRHLDRLREAVDLPLLLRPVLVRPATTGCG